MKSIMCAVLLGFAVGAVAMADEGKIGVVDMTVLLEQFEQTQTMETLLEQQVVEVREELDLIGARLERQRDLVNSLQQEAEDRALSDEKRDEKVGEFRRQMARLQEMRQEMAKVREARQMELSEQKLRMHRTITGTLSGYVERYAKREGYVLILDKSGLALNGMPAVVFASGALDVTAAVLKMLPGRTATE